MMIQEERQDYAGDDGKKYGNEETLDRDLL